MKTKSSDLCLGMIGGLYSTSQLPALQLTLVEFWDKGLSTGNIRFKWLN